VHEMNLTLRSIYVHTSKRLLICIKILCHEADDFTSPPKEGVVQSFISLKIHLPWPGLNPQTLGPVASMLTITPLRTTVRLYAN
jgi:hypothetical protein